jgi:FkbM family methyltransferase
MNFKEVTHGGIKMLVPEMAEGVVAEVFDEDAYRIKHIARGATVIDIGAHIGCFALRCAVERGCAVVAFEPDPLVFGFLVANIHLNGAASRIVPTFSAVGAEVGPRDFYVNLGHPAGSSLWPDDKNANYGRINVPCTTLNNILPEDGLVDVLKIDCEGAEREICTDEFLPALTRTKRIVMEWYNYDGGKYRDLLESAGFSVEICGGGKPQPPWDPSIGGGMLYAQKLPSSYKPTGYGPSPEGKN